MQTSEYHLYEHRSIITCICKHRSIMYTNIAASLYANIAVSYMYVQNTGASYMGVGREVEAGRGIRDYRVKGRRRGERGGREGRRGGGSE